MSVALAEAPVRSSKRELEESVRCCCKKIEDIASGSLWIITAEAAEHDRPVIYTSAALIDELLEQRVISDDPASEYSEQTVEEVLEDLAERKIIRNAEMQDSFSDVLDIYFKIDRCGKCTSVEIFLALGGPSIKVTFTGYVEGKWGCDEVSCPLSPYAYYKIMEWAKEQYEICKHTRCLR